MHRLYVAIFTFMYRLYVAIYTFMHRLCVWPYTPLCTDFVWPYTPLCIDFVWPYTPLCIDFVWPYTPMCIDFVWPYTPSCIDFVWPFLGFSQPSAPLSSTPTSSVVPMAMLVAGDSLLLSSNAAHRLNAIQKQILVSARRTAKKGVKTHFLQYMFTN